MENSNNYNNNYNNYNNKHNSVLLVKEFNIKNLRVKPLEEPKTKDGKPSAQRYSQILYEHKPNNYSVLSVQTNKFPIIYNGLPSKEYMKNNIKELAQYKLPLSVLNMDDIKNTNDEDYYNDVSAFENAIKPLADLVKSIDSYLSNDENKKKLFGDEYSKFEYIPLYKEVDVDEIKSKSKNRENNKAYAICDYLKLRFKCKFIDNDDFEVFSKSYNTDENGKNELGNLRFNDLKKHLKFRNNVAFVIDFQKLYANKAASGNGKDKKKNYGVILQINMLDIHSKPKSLFVKQLRDENEISNLRNENENDLKDNETSETNENNENNETNETNETNEKKEELKDLKEDLSNINLQTNNEKSKNTKKGKK